MAFGDQALDDWFKEKWVDISKKDKSGKHPPCGRKDADKGKYPKCRPSKRVTSKTPKTTKEMSSSEKKKAVKNKRKTEKKQSKPAGGKARKPKRAPSLKRRKNKKKKSNLEIKLYKVSEWLDSQGFNKEAAEARALSDFSRPILRFASKEYYVGKKVFVRTMHYGNLPATITEIKRSGPYGYDLYKVEFDQSMPPRAKEFPLIGQSKWYSQNNIAILNENGELKFDAAWHDQTAGSQVSNYWKKNGLAMGWSKAYKELHNMKYTWAGYLAADLVGLLPFVGAPFDMTTTLAYWEQWNKTKVDLIGIEAYKQKTPEYQKQYRYLISSAISSYIGAITGLLSLVLEAVAILSAASTAGTSLVVTTVPFVALEALLKSYKWILTAGSTSATLAGGAYEAASKAIDKIKEFWENDVKFAVIDNENKEVKHAEGTMDEFLAGDFSKILKIVSVIQIRDLDPYINELYAIHGHHIDKVEEKSIEENKNA